MVKSCFFQLRLLSKVKSFLSLKNVEKVIHYFFKVGLLLSLYVGLSHSAMSRLQSVQNVAARPLTGAPVLRSLHWLPVRYRVDIKI